MEFSRRFQREVGHRRDFSNKLYWNKTLRGIFGSVFLITLIEHLIYRECGLLSDSHYGSSYSTLETILIELYCAGYNKPRLAPLSDATPRPPSTFSPASVLPAARRSFSSAVPGGPTDQYDTVSADTGAAAPDNKARTRTCPISLHLNSVPNTCR